MSVNITLDDTSPMITWGDGWKYGSVDTDPFTPRYFGSTFRCTETEGATGQIKFKGSGIWFYGAKRDNHGVFEIDLDGEVSTLDGYDAKNAAQVMLFGKGGLDAGVEHTLKFTNTPSKNQGTEAKRPWLDLDYLVIETRLGEADALTATTRIDDASPRYTYEGQSITTNFPATKGYYAETGHLMNTAGETAKIDFIGQTVAVFGGVNFNHGDYGVTLDGGAEQVFSGEYAQLKAGAVLFWATDLENTTHSLVIKNLGTGKMNNFDLDYIEYNYTLASDSADSVTSVTTIAGVATTINVNATNAISATTGPATTTSSSSSSLDLVMATSSMGQTTEFGPVAPVTSGNVSPTSGAINGATASEEKNGTSPGLIAGGAVGGAIALILLGAILFLLRRKNRRNNEEPDRWQDKPIVDLTGDDSPKYAYGNGISPFSDGASATPWDTGARPVQHANAPYGNAASPYLSYIPPAPPSHNPSFYPHSVEPSSEHGRSPVDEGQAQYMPGMNRNGSYSHGTYGGIQQQQRSGPSSGSAGSVGEVGRALLVPVDQMYQPHSGRSQFPPGEAGYQPPEAIFGSEFSYGPPGSGTVVGSPHTRAVTALRNKGNLYSAALPPTSVAPSSAVSPDDFHNRTRVQGRAVDMGPIPVSPSSSGRHELPPNYFQATEPLPSQLTPESQSRRPNMI